jgi:chromosome segregation ATPase
MEVAKEARESKGLVKRLQGELEMAKGSKGRLEDELEGMQRDRMQASQQSHALDQATTSIDSRIASTTLTGQTG